MKYTCETTHVKTLNSRGIYEVVKTKHVQPRVAGRITVRYQSTHPTVQSPYLDTTEESIEAGRITVLYQSTHPTVQCPYLEMREESREAGRITVIYRSTHPTVQCPYLEMREGSGEAGRIYNRIMFMQCKGS